MAQSDPLTDELVRISDRLDRLIADRQSGARPSQTRHDGHVDQVEELAARLVRAVRGPGRPQNAPIGRTAGGQLIF